VDSDEFLIALSASKQSSFVHSDPSLIECMKHIDSAMRLRHLRACDLFELLDSDGGGTLSRTELQAGLVSAVMLNLYTLAKA
jgi:hypothetical protein